MSVEVKPLRLVAFTFDDPLTDLILDLDHRRQFILRGTTPPLLFFQLKDVFHIVETIGSARIEGNRTTIAEIIEHRLDTPPEDERIREIINIEEALAFVEETWSSDPDSFRIDHGLIRQLHALVTSSLSVQGEGDRTPGQYRTVPVKIARSTHMPPEALDVHGLMDELLNFLLHPDPPKYDLIKIALAHHRFAWIHPFSNGNGRTVRLFTYALLLNSGFRVGGDHPASRILNPTAVFCADRDNYYEKLEEADNGSDASLLSWCSYVLNGLKAELDKVDRLLDYDWLGKNILAPAIAELHRTNEVSKHEQTILMKTLSMPIIRNQDIQQTLGAISTVQVSRILKNLRDKRLLVSAPGAEYKYQLGISKSPLLRMVMRQLDRNGFLPLRNEV